MEQTKHDVFISYSREDYVDEHKNVIPGNEVSKIKDALTEAGITYWFDEEGIYSGQNFVEKIVTNIEHAKIFLFLSTANANKSPWTCKEIACADEFKKHIIPVRIDASPYNKEVLFRIADLDYIEYYTNPQKGIKDLIKSIKTYLDELAAEERRKKKRTKRKEAEREIKELKVESSSCFALHHDKHYCHSESESDSFKYNNGLSFFNINTPGLAFATAPFANAKEIARTFYPTVDSDIDRNTSKRSIWSRLFKRNYRYDVYSSIFAPAEIRRESYMLVQVYLHLYEETEKVKELSQEAQKDVERRDYIPLQCKLKKNDKVDVQLDIRGKKLLFSDKKRINWKGSFTKCSFDYFVPKNIDVNELSCTTALSVNDVPVGEMKFISNIVKSPRQLNSEITAHKFNKVFISYSHEDEAKVKSFHEGLKLAGIEHFFDRHYLKAGDIFPKVIQDYINSADLFVLFWSENASKSDYVKKERTQALKRAFPQVKPQEEAKLSIYPVNIEPRADLPNDMKDNYHFGEI